MPQKGQAKKGHPQKGKTLLPNKIRLGPFETREEGAKAPLRIWGLFVPDTRITARLLSRSSAADTLKCPFSCEFGTDLFRSTKLGSAVELEE